MLKRYLIIATIFLAWSPLSAQTWTATVLDKPASDTSGSEIVAVHFADDQGHNYDVNHFIPFGAPSTDLGDFVRDTIAMLTSQKAVKSTAPDIGAVITPSATATDTNAAIKATFLADYLLLKKYQAAISHGLISAADLDYVAQLNKTSSEFIANKVILLPLVDVGP